MITSKYVALETSESNPSFSQLCTKFQQLLMPSYTEQEVAAFLTKEHPRLLCAFMLYSEERLVGFTTIGFFHKQIDNEATVIARISTAVEKNFRGGTLPLELMWEKLSAYKKLVGDMPMYFAGYIANPLMYNAVTESIWEYYPKPSIEPPLEIIHLLKQLKGVYNDKSGTENDFTFKVPFCVNIDEQVQQAINCSTNTNVLYYKKINPGYLRQQVLVVIAPLTEENIKRSIEKLSERRASRKAA